MSMVFAVGFIWQASWQGRVWSSLRSGGNVFITRSLRSISLLIVTKVLALLLLSGSPFQVKFPGLYTVLQQPSDRNYLVATPDCRTKSQLFHINLSGSCEPFLDQGVSHQGVDCSCPIGFLTPIS